MKAVTLQDYKQRMLPVLVYIQQRLDEPLSLETLATVAHFSPYHFHRVFRGMVGESVQEHIRRLRLERAALRLKSSSQPVTEIAFDAGYETHEAFSRAFKTAFEVSPSQFRALRQPRRPVAIGRAPSGVHYSEENVVKRFKTVKPDPNNFVVQVQTLPARHLAFVRHTGPYQDCGKAWDKLCAYLGKEGFFTSTTRFIGLCHDDPEVTPPDKVRYDACATVGPEFRAVGEIGVQTIPGGDYAVTMHYGPYQNLSKTYARVFGQWLPRSGREMGDGPSLELYQNDPNSTAPEDLVTEIQVPLK
jgi:AraC family transcriptional regulator